MTAATGASAPRGDARFGPVRTGARRELAARIGRPPLAPASARCSVPAAPPAPSALPASSSMCATIGKRAAASAPDVDTPRQPRLDCGRRALVDRLLVRHCQGEPDAAARPRRAPFRPAAARVARGGIDLMLPVAHDHATGRTDFGRRGYNLAPSGPRTGRSRRAAHSSLFGGERIAGRPVAPRSRTYRRDARRLAGDCGASLYDGLLTRL